MIPINENYESPEQPPRKKLKAKGGQSTASSPLESPTKEASAIQTLKLAGGPNKWSLKRFELWKQERLCDCKLICSDGTVIRAWRGELAVWSRYFYELLCKSEDEEMRIPDADPGILQTLIRAVFEREITIMPGDAQELLALADRLQIDPVMDVVEKYFVSQLNYENAIDALLLAAKHSCMGLRQAAIPLAATNFDRINPSKLVLLNAGDIKELLACAQLCTTEEHTLFSIIKHWSKGPNAGSTDSEVDEQLLKLIAEIRLDFIPASQLHSILDDSWLQQHPRVLSAVAKALVGKTGPSTPSRKNRVGHVVRFQGYAKLVEQSRSKGHGHPLFSPPFELDFPECPQLGRDADDRGLWHIQVYPIGFQRHPNKVGIFLAVEQGSNQENPDALAHLRFRLTLINQQDPEKSITADFSQPTRSSGKTLRFWGSQQFVDVCHIDKGFVVNDTLIVSVLPMGARPSSKPSPALGTKRAFAEIDLTTSSRAQNSSAAP